jgi:hypothetical protein
MTVQEKIYALLTPVMAQTYPVYAPQGTVAPFIVFDILSITPNKSKQHTSHVDEVTVRVTCFNTSLAAAGITGESVRAALDNQRDISNKIDRITFDNGQSDFDEESKHYYHTQDFSVRQWK